MDRTRTEALRAAVEALAAEDVADVVAQARAEARIRVKDLLADALTDALVDNVHAELAQPTAEVPPSPSVRAAPPPPPDPAPTGSLGVYVYGVVASGAELPGGLAGIEPGHPPKLLSHNGLAAVISEVPLEEFEEQRLREHLGDMRWVEHTARAHEHVLEGVAECTTLIPLRMCSIYRTPDGVREMLARETVALTDALRQLHGKAEWGVKVFGAAAGPDQAASGDEPEPPASGTDYMRRRRTERDARFQADDELLDACAAIHECLTEISADALTAPPQRPEVSGHDGPMLLNGIYLVATADEELFLARVDELRERHESLGITLVPTGPWPAYNFVPGAIGAAW
jgi:Gas vesicle synthesis protein GvpL/GvpF